MRRNRIQRPSAIPIGILSILLSLGLGSCGLIPVAGRPGDLLKEFYEYQEDGSAEISSDLFTGSAVNYAEDLIQQRTSEYGSYRSHRRVGSNRMISMRGNGREETITYIIEVTCDEGRTRETLIIVRRGMFEPYRIAEYGIEELKRTEAPTPMGTSST